MVDSSATFFIFIAMKLWKVHIKDYCFGTIYYDLFVLADTESNMIRTVYDYPAYRKSDDAQIVGYDLVDMSDETNRVL